MTDQAHYLAVFTSDKTGPRWRAWYAMAEAEQRATDAAGMAAIKDGRPGIATASSMAAARWARPSG